MTMYALIHHVNGDEYIASIEGDTITYATGPIAGSELPADKEQAADWLRNQFGEDLGETGKWIREEINALRAVVARYFEE